MIVINNGVAKWVNDIPISATESYANKLRKMINFFGAENRVKILLQSELVGFDPGYSFEPFQSNNLRPRLIKSTNRKEYTIQWVSYRFPWKENTNIIVKGLDNE